MSKSLESAVLGDKFCWEILFLVNTTNCDRYSVGILPLIRQLLLNCRTALAVLWMVGASLFTIWRQRPKRTSFGNCLVHSELYRMLRWCVTTQHKSARALVLSQWQTTRKHSSRSLTSMVSSWEIAFSRFPSRRWETCLQVAFCQMRNPGLWRVSVS